MFAPPTTTMSAEFLRLILIYQLLTILIDILQGKLSKPEYYGSSKEQAQQNQFP
jgi:hypothetical protein